MADISRSEVATLIQEEYANTLLDYALQGSTALAAFPTVSMGSKLTHLPVLATLPDAGWVSESATAPEGVKPQSQVTWEDRTLVAEELAVIVPVPEALLADLDYDLWSEVKPAVVEAIGVAVDQAILYGNNKPAEWPDGILTGATSASHAVDRPSARGTGTGTGTGRGPCRALHRCFLAMSAHAPVGSRLR